MSEGELKKRIQDKAYPFAYGDPKIMLTTHYVFPILDEAKADFIDAAVFSNLKHIEDFIFFHEHLPKDDERKADNDLIEILKWFLKWFGGNKNGR